jgi:EAL domain-containing protein (putative c-di-GMP-specific phosphodiesterase class I)
MVERVSKRLALEQDLRVAIRDGQFFVEYQPLVDLETQRIASFEALVRWHHPTRGRVSPAEFIDVAEKAGLIADIGNFVVTEVCRQIGEWQRGGAAVVPVAVNVSTRQFEQRSVIDLVCRATRAASIEPPLLHIELTESAFMEDRDRNVAILQELREMGVEVSVDDFGTGYSSLAYLRDLPIDCLKIDRSFVMALGTPEGDAIVEAIIRMARSRGVTTVAEGVESLAQARRLRELGANYGQGFYFSKPVAPDVCATLLLAASETVRRRLARA